MTNDVSEEDIREPRRIHFRHGRDIDRPLGQLAYEYDDGIVTGLRSG